MDFGFSTTATAECTRTMEWIDGFHNKYGHRCQQNCDCEFLGFDGIAPKSYSFFKNNLDPIAKQLSKQLIKNIRKEVKDNEVHRDAFELSLKISGFPIHLNESQLLELEKTVYDEEGYDDNSQESSESAESTESSETAELNDLNEELKARQKNIAASNKMLG